MFEINRIASALVAAPIAIAAIVWLPFTWFVCLVGVSCTWVAYEWSLLAGIASRMTRIVLAILIGSFSIAISFLTLSIEFVYLIGVLVWIPAVLVVLLYPRSEFLLQMKWLNMGFGALICIVFANSVVFTRTFDSHGLHLLILVIAVWAIDSGAYFCGRLLGHFHLHPAVSPNKTWEGVIGGTLCGTLVILLGAVYVLKISTFAFILELALFVVAFAIFGDLFESALKRSAEVKESGFFLRGHGGAFDRLDSLLAASPYYALAVGLTR